MFSCCKSDISREIYEVRYKNDQGKNSIKYISEFDEKQLADSDKFSGAVKIQKSDYELI